jgi:hypothetical protein
MIINLYVEGISEKVLFTEGDYFKKCLTKKSITLNVFPHQGKGELPQNLNA